jgi:hypothetical protein
MDLIEQKEEIFVPEVAAYIFFGADKDLVGGVVAVVKLNALT